MNDFMSEYELILFDLDGTLTDPESGLIKSFSYALSRMGVDCSDTEGLKCFIGPPLYDEWQKVYGFSPEEAGRALDYFHEYFEVDGWCDNVMYDGIPALLSGLRAAGKRIALATSKPEEMSKEIMEKFELAQYFEKICGATLDGSRSHKADVIAYLLQQVGDIRQAVMVGDTEFDVIGAAAHGIPAIGVSWGYGKVESMEKAGAIAIAHSMEEMVELLNQ